MRLFHSVWILLPACLGFLSFHLAAQQPGAPAPNTSAEKKPPPSPPRLDSKGAEWLKEASAALDAKRHPWIAATLWQQIDVHGMFLRAEGTYRTGPENRLRLELKLDWGDATGTLLSVSDGSTLWERLQIGAQAPVASKTDLKKMREALSMPGVAEARRVDFWQAMALTGVSPLLQQIQQHMTVTNHEMQTWRGRDVVKLTAFWSESTLKKLFPENRPWPAFLPKKCYLYLDATDSPTKYWPYRVEWWGPSGARSEDTRLLQIEFRDPKLDQPLDAEQAAKEFSFSPGDVKVEDATLARIRAINSQR